MACEAAPLPLEGAPAPLATPPLLGLESFVTFALVKPLTLSLTCFGFGCPKTVKHLPIVNVLRVLGVPFYLV